MEIKYIDKEEKPTQVDFEEFADKHNLKLEVTRYSPERTTVKFEDIEISSNEMLIFAYGDASTPAAALRIYASQISGKKIVKNSGIKKERVEIDCPRLTVSPKLIRDMEIMSVPI